MVSIIAAVDRNLGIGFQNKLLFWLPNDLKRFKALTTGNISPWSGESWIILCPRLGKEKVQANNKISKCFIVLY